MFVEDGKPKDKKAEELRPERMSGVFSGPVYGQAEDSGRSFGAKTAVSAAVLLVSFAGAAVYYFLSQRSIAPAAAPPKAGAGTSSLNNILPNVDGSGQGGADAGNEDTGAEKILFGQFYQEPAPPADPPRQSYRLPVNVKSDTVNYYDISRKIDLSPYVDALNAEGFAIIESPYTSGHRDFYQTYRKLAEDGLPLAVTSDFVHYHFHNELQQAMQEVRSGAFYDTVWGIYKRLYDVALARYKKRAQSGAAANDPVLEGARMETSYLAVLLGILSPRPGQTSKDPILSPADPFTEQDAFYYNYDMPAEIAGEVGKELALVLSARGVKRSPVMLYDRDYSAFVIPPDLGGKAKLGNFHQAARWLNTLFPLYAKDGDCEDCLLDRDDWLIAQTAAAFLAKDMYESHEARNEWAIVYRFIAFSEGLRSDLTYLDNYRALEAALGKGFDPEKAFARQNGRLYEDATAVRDKLAEKAFKPIEGGYDRSDPAERPKLGVRMLQENFWPNDHFVKLVFSRPAAEKAPAGGAWCKSASALEEGCFSAGATLLSAFREAGAEAGAMDNRFTPILSANIEKARSEVAAFDKFTWNGNVYWMTMDTGRHLLDYRKDFLPAYMRSAAWSKEKDLNTALGRWTAVHLGGDGTALYEKEESNALGDYRDCQAANFVEPYPASYNDLIARAGMLVSAMEELGVTDKTNAAAIELKETVKNISGLQSIIGKELTGKPLNSDDCRYIEDFATRYQVVSQAKREYRYRNPYHGATVSASVTGVKLAAMVYDKEGRLTIALGPIFNYRESGSVK